MSYSVALIGSRPGGVERTGTSHVPLTRRDVGVPPPPYTHFHRRRPNRPRLRAQRSRRVRKGKPPGSRERACAETSSRIGGFQTAGRQIASRAGAPRSPPPSLSLYVSWQPSPGQESASEYDYTPPLSANPKPLHTQPLPACSRTHWSTSCNFHPGSDTSPPSPSSVQLQPSGCASALYALPSRHR